MKKFRLTSQFGGYRNKRDKTNIGAGFLVEGSQNVVINDAEKIQAREGYTLDGQASTATKPPRDSFEWITSSGTGLPLRFQDDELQFRFIASDATITWEKVADGFSTTDRMNFTTYWVVALATDQLIFVNGDDNLFQWNGAVTTFASDTGSTITKEGTTTWAQDRFFISSNQTIVLNGVEYSYSGGVTTTTLTGVTPDPTLTTNTAGDVIIQKVVTNASKPSVGLSNDIVATNRNQLWVGDKTLRDINISKNDDFTDFAFSSPRLPGEGALITIDSTPVGFVVQEEDMYISGIRNDWYRSSFTLSSDNTAEILEIKKLKTSEEQGALDQGAIAKIKNQVVFISNEPTLDTLGRLENLTTPQAKPLSDLIKTDFDTFDFTDAHVKYHKNKINIVLPAESVWLVFDIERQFWYPPQIVPFQRLAVIDGDLYAHSSAVTETYKLFDGFNDNGAPIEARATFAYRLYGRRDWQKTFDEWFTEGYISSNTDITLRLKYEFDGAETIQEFVIAGDDDTIIFSGAGDPSLGKASLGKEPLGSSVTSPDEVSKFRVIQTTVKTDFYEIQAEYESNQQDAQWELLATGGNVLLSSNDNISIKK